jgi:hypothetical protein
MSSFSTGRHFPRPPDVENLLQVLKKWNVEYVLVGSVAAAAYGVDVQPGDLDIVPDTQEANLERLRRCLEEIEATPRGPLGDWTILNTGEWKWIGRPTTDEELAAWTFDARDVRTIDHLFVTCHGNFDVVPIIAGRYAALRPRAVPRVWSGCNLWITHVDELLARMTIPPVLSNCSCHCRSRI